jgi:hypothetical protein
MKWIFPSYVGTSQSGRTCIWSIKANDGNFLLGEVRWYAPWRKYAFFPEPNTLFEPDCLRDIADFCAKQTDAHRATTSVAKRHEATL